MRADTRKRFRNDDTYVVYVDVVLSCSHRICGICKRSPANGETIAFLGRAEGAHSRVYAYIFLVVALKSFRIPVRHE